jgi:hypothetical protein
MLPTAVESRIDAITNASEAPPPGEIDTRFTAKADFAPGVNQIVLAGVSPPGDGSPDRASQPVASTEVTSETSEPMSRSIHSRTWGAGERETENRVNHAQVVVPQEAPIELQLLLGNLGVNLTPAQRGRKSVFDDFLRGRLVSLLAMGLSLRQAAAALGLSHSAVWKELKRNPELTEQVTSARFQAQIEPLLVILRESKRSWRAATWIVNHLQRQVSQREETPDEARVRRQEETDELRTRSRQELEDHDRWEYERQIERVRRENGIKLPKRKTKVDRG